MKKFNLVFIIVVAIIAIIIVYSNSVSVLPVIGTLFGALGILYIISGIYRSNNN